MEKEIKEIKTMKKNKLQIEETYKEFLHRYDLKFIYKDKLQLLFILPEEEKQFMEKLKADKAVLKLLKMFYLFYKIFGATAFNYATRENGVDFLLEYKKQKHDGEVFIEVLED